LDVLFRSLASEQNVRRQPEPAKKPARFRPPGVLPLKAGEANLKPAEETYEELG